MADREIRLIGSFQDDITPKLNRLNRQLLGTIRQFEKLQGKIAPVAAEMAKFNSAASMTAGNLKGQRSAIEENIRVLRQYRTELSKTATAQGRMGAGGVRPPRAPGGGNAPVAPRGGGGGEMAAGVVGVTLGNQLANVITSAVVAGFQTGAQIMLAPFRYGASAIAERIRDEMSDVRAAGGLFSISQRQPTQFLPSFAAAEAYVKDQNRYLAKLAGSLPGDTQEYIQVSKQISDGIFTIVAQDSKNAKDLARNLAAERGATAQEIAKLAGSGAQAMQQTGKELVGEMTKLTVLAGLGGRQGAYGLPQLTERMLSEDQVSMGMFQRYAAIFRDPMIKGALERNIKNINAAGKNTTARLEALRNTFKEIVTPDLVRRYQRTTAGVLEALKTSFLNPEVGLLGLGRPLMLSSAKFNEFGERLYTLSRDITVNGKTLEKGSEITASALQAAGYSLSGVATAATDNLSIFDYLRDTFANVMIVLQPVIDNIVNIFDPFTELGRVLAEMRERTMQFQLAFESYGRYLREVTAKGIKDSTKRAQFEGTIPLRASLQALNDAMAAYGGRTREEFDRISKILERPETSMAEMGQVLRQTLSEFLSSDMATGIGEALGTIVGTVVSQVGEMMKAAAGMATGSKLAQGFSAGFKAAGGPQGVSDVIKSVFHLFGKLLIEVFKAAPLEVSAAVLMTFGLPAVVGALATSVSTAIGTWMTTKVIPAIAARIAASSFAANVAGWLGALAPAVAALFAKIGTLIAGINPIVLVGVIVVGLLAVVNHFRDEILGVVKRIESWVNANLTGALKQFVLGFIKYFRGAMDVLKGLFDYLSALFRGDQRAMAASWEMIKGGVMQMVQGAGQMIMNLFGAIKQAVTDWFNWVTSNSFKGPSGPKEGDTRNIRGGGRQVYRGGRWVTAYAGSGSSAMMSFARAAAVESRNMPPGAKPVVANSSELIIPTRAAGQGDVTAIVSPLMSIDAKTSTVAAYINQMRSGLSNAIRQTTQAVNSMSGRISAGMPVKVVNQPTVKFAMGGMGPIGGGIGKFPKTSGYGMRWGRMHTGNDYAMPVGTKLGIGGPGTVLGAGNWGGYGMAMDIGGPGGVVYRFGHLSKFLAPVGAQLPPGFPFALSGNTGRSTGPHLHFEARPGGMGPVNPDAFAGIIRAGFAGTPVGGLLSAAQLEASKMPYGAQLAVRNTDEIFMKPTQMSSLVEGATRAGAEGVGNITTGPITISIDGYNQDPRQLTETIAAELIGAMYRKSRSEVLTS